MRWSSGAAFWGMLILGAGLFGTFLQLFAQNATPSATPTMPVQTPAPVQSAPIPRPLIVIDPAHGGSDPGAILNPAILEKDVTLALARRLRQELNNRGISSQLSREGDSNVTTDQRATAANSMRPALFIAVHASSQGSGIRILTSMPPVASDDRGPFHGWQAAQSSSLPRSRLIQGELAAAIQKMRFPVRAFEAPLRPLSSITVPAIAVEIAPTTGDLAQLGSPDYQNMAVGALANAIASTRAKWEVAP